METPNKCLLTALIIQGKCAPSAVFQVLLKWVWSIKTYIITVCTHFTFNFKMSQNPNPRTSAPHPPPLPTTPNLCYSNLRVSFPQHGTKAQNKGRKTKDPSVPLLLPPSSWVQLQFKALEKETRKDRATKRHNASSWHAHVIRLQKMLTCFLTE